MSEVHGGDTERGPKFTLPLFQFDENKLAGGRESCSSIPEAKAIFLVESLRGLIRNQMNTCISKRRTQSGKEGTGQICRTLLKKCGTSNPS
jgi:hypothetical protein